MRKKLFIPLIILVLLFIATAAALIIWAPWKGAGEYVTAVVIDESQSLELELADETAIIVPPGSLPEGAAISIKKIDPKEAPPLPEGFDGVESIYDFSTDKPLKGTVTLRIATPEVTADSAFLLSHYCEGQWEVVPFALGDKVVFIETDDLSPWGWLNINIGELADLIDEKVMKYADIDTYINWYEDFIGISELMELNLESTPSCIKYDDREAKGLISASAVPIDGEKVRLRVRNETKFYLQISFQGAASIEPQRGSYIDPFDIVRIHMPDIAYMYLREFPSSNFLLLPEGTAEFNAVYKPGEILKVNARFSDTAALFSLDPAIGLFIPVADLEVVAAIRDIFGEGSKFVLSIPNIEKSFSDYTINLLDLGVAASRAGVLLGEDALKTLANMLVLPAVIECRKEYLEGRVADILQKGPYALNGVSLVFEFLPENNLEGKVIPEPEEEVAEEEIEEIVEEKEGFSSSTILDDEYCNKGELIYDKHTYPGYDSGFIGLGFTLPEGTKIYSPFKGLVDEVGVIFFGGSGLYGFEILDASDPEWGWKHQRDFLFVGGGVRTIIEMKPMFTENPVEKGQAIAEVIKNQKIITPEGKEYDIAITFMHYDADSNIWSYNEELLNNFFHYR